MSETQRDGVGLGVAVLLALGALVVGLSSGLILGVTGGYLMAHYPTGDEGPLATVEQAARAPEAGELAPRPAPDATTEDSERGAPESARSSDATPAMPGIPGVVLGGGEGPYLGVEVATEPITDATGAALPGAAILAVVPGTAAEEAGLLPGDRIVAFDQEPVTNGTDLAAVISRAEVGQEIALKVIRGKEELSMTATLAARPGVIPLAPGQPDIDKLLEQMPPELREQFRRMLRPNAGDSDA